MMTTMFAIACIGQLTPDTVLDNRLHDARFYRWVQEAQSQADQWAFIMADRLYPTRERLSCPVGSEAFYRLARAHNYAQMVLRQAARKQVQDAYDLSVKEYQTMVRHKLAGTLRHQPEYIQKPAGHEGFRMAQFPFDLEPTRFDPSKVRLPDAMAKRIRYVNPAPPQPAKKPMTNADLQEMLRQRQKVLPQNRTGSGKDVGTSKSLKTP